MISMESAAGQLSLAYSLEQCIFSPKFSNNLISLIFFSLFLWTLHECLYICFWCWFFVPQATEWAPDDDTKRSCQSKGKSEVLYIIQRSGEIWPFFALICGKMAGDGSTSLALWHVCLQEECQNYIRVLLTSGRTLFTCGTNAFAPVCITRQVGMTVYPEMWAASSALKRWDRLPSEWR